MSQGIFRSWKTESFGYSGLFLIQGAGVPVMLDRFVTKTIPLPPAVMVWMVFIGLACYFARAVIQRDTCYLVSNGTGLTINGTMLLFIYGVIG